MKKKTYILRQFLLIGVLLLTLASTSFADRVLSFPLRIQEHNQWCWDATSKAILDYYGTYVAQCTIANWAWGRSDCCGSYSFDANNACNQPNYLWGSGSQQAVIANWGVSSTVYSAALPLASCAYLLDYKLPFVIRFGWTGDGGHVMDGYGVIGNYLYYMDPWPGNGYTVSYYPWVVSASDHTWTHTLYMTTFPHGRAEIIGTWNGIWYRNLANDSWAQTYAWVPDGPIASGDVTADGRADIVTCWASGLWYQNGATRGWTQVYNSAPGKVAAGDITGDGRAEIVGTWNGIWYRNLVGGWTQTYAYVPNGAIAVGDVTGDGRADMVSCWASGLWYQNGATLGWVKVYAGAPGKLAVADITGDGRAEIIGTWNGIWYWNPVGGWTQMYAGVPSGPIAAGDVTGDGRADVVSCWGSGLWYQNGANFGWTNVYGSAPTKLAVGNITGD